MTIAAGSEQEKIVLPLRPQELESISFSTDQPVTIRTQKPIEGFALLKVPDIDLDQEKPWLWEKSEGKENPFLGKTAELEVTNLNTGEKASPARLTINWKLVPEFPDVVILPISAAVLLIIVVLYSLFRLTIRRVAAVTSSTMKEAIGQPIFAVAIVAGIVLLLSFIVIPYNTFGEDVKMLKDSGLTLVKVLALLVVIWTASVTVSDEIEGRTALTVLSKPLTRRQFVVGKFIGLALVALLIFMILGAVLMSTTSLKVVYDARESSKTAPLWSDCDRDDNCCSRPCSFPSRNHSVSSSKPGGIDTSRNDSEPYNLFRNLCPWAPCTAYCAVKRWQTGNRAICWPTLRNDTPRTRTFHNRGRCDWWRSGAVGISRMGSNLRRFIFCDSLTHRTCTLPKP